MMQRLLYLSLRAISSLRHWVVRRFTRPGLFVLASLVVSAVLGVDTNQTMAYQIFTFLLALLIAAFISSLFLKPRVTAQRNLPRYATASQSFACRITLHNQSGKLQSGLSLLEDMADPRPSFAEFIGTPQTPRNWRGFGQGYRRWRQTVARNNNASTQEQQLPLLPTMGSTEIRTEITPLHRGHVRFAGVTVAKTDPFGLCRACTTISDAQSVLVLPKRYNLPPIPLPGTRQYQQGGVMLASAVGDSEEFIGLRDYRPGDPLQRIHWKSFARIGKPVVKEFQDEFFERHALVLDTSLQSGDDALFEEAVSVAASFVYAIDTQECLLDLMFVEAKAYCYSAGRGQLLAKNMLEVLAGVQANAGLSFTDLHHAVMGRRAELSSCICILLAWDDARKAFIEQLHAMGLPVLALVVSSLPIEKEATPWLRVLEPGNIQQGLALI